jgi:hypothetical protein
LPGAFVWVTYHPISIRIISRLLDWAAVAANIFTLARTLVKDTYHAIPIGIIITLGASIALQSEPFISPIGACILGIVNSIPIRISRRRQRAAIPAQSVPLIAFLGAFVIIIRKTIPIRVSWGGR